MPLENVRRQLAHPKTSIQLGLLGVIAGTSSALVIILFRLTIEKLQLQFVDQFDNFTSVSDWHRIALPITGALLIAATAIISRYRHHSMGIPFVIHRIKTKYGMMPIKNAINQFIGGATALICGFSVGREGPSVHIGASAASFISQLLKLPYNSMTILTGCGISAAIAASFNTPLAAVIFVMEVVLREYKIYIFIPIMLSAVIGTMLTRWAFGDNHELSFFEINAAAEINYFYLLVCCFFVTTLAWLFNRGLMTVIRTFQPVNTLKRYLLAGLITGIIGYFVPQAMGSGMGAIQFALSDNLGFVMIAVILFAKFFATIFAIGLGIPGGIIGPVLGLGVLLGALFGLVGVQLGLPPEHLHLYAVLGMAGLMAVTLHSPLAALVALLELTGNPEVIAPAMFVITISYTLGVQIFNNRSILIQQLEYQQLPYLTSPATATLQKVGVLANLDDHYQILDNANKDQVQHWLDTRPTGQSLVIRNQYIMGVEFILAEYASKMFTDNNFQPADPLSIQYWPLQGLSSQVSLAEAFELLHEKRCGAVYIYQDHVENIIGLIHWDQLRTLLVRRNNLT